MVFEHEIRRELSAIVASCECEVERARRLLELSERVRTGAWQLAECSTQLMVLGEGKSAARMREASQRLFDLNAEIRAQMGTPLTDRKMALAMAG